jgi:hypothetical protein
MNTRDIATIRLANQQIADAASTSPAEVVTRLLAIQAQDYRGALWSIGLRHGNNGMFMPTIVAHGRVIGTWRSAVARRALAVTPLPFAPLSSSDARAFATAAGRYEEFLGHEKLS